jgi:hypothetical protein
MVDVASGLLVAAAVDLEPKALILEGIETTKVSYRLRGINKSIETI